MVSGRLGECIWFMGAPFFARVFDTDQQANVVTCIASPDLGFHTG